MTTPHGMYHKQLLKPQRKFTKEILQIDDTSDPESKSSHSEHEL